MRASLVLVAAVASAAPLAACVADAGDEFGAREVAAAAPDASTCRDGSESDQRYGTPCLCCHSDEFGVAGSVDLASPTATRVVVAGADGDVADMAVNSFGNFFRHFPLAVPVRAVVYGPDGSSIAMRELAPSADCNACHFAGGIVPPIVGP